MAITFEGNAVTKPDSSTLLASLFAADENVSGPLSHVAYAQSNNSNNYQLAAVSGNYGTAIIDDPKSTFATILDGNDVLAPSNPITPQSNANGNLSGDQSAPAKPAKYVVADGDTIGSISNKFNVSDNTILWANKLSDASVIRPGDTLIIPPTTGVLYSVEDGDTIGSIAEKFNVKAKEIIDYNQLGDGSKIAIGHDIMIPGGFVDEPMSPPRQLANEPVVPEVVPSPAPGNTMAGGWLWPTITRHISQMFGAPEFGRRHTGIDIDNRGSGVPIFAAKAGVVQFAGWNSGGYGNLTVIEHGNGLETYYGHASKILVKPGETVSKGQTIAIMGSTGNSTGPHLHFEIRRNGEPLNPLSVL